MLYEVITVDGQKMSKSLGNQYTLKDLLARGLSPRSIRYALISVHYRQKLNFTFEGIEAAGRALKRVDDLRFVITSYSIHYTKLYDRVRRSDRGPDGRLGKDGDAALVVRDERLRSVGQRDREGPLRRGALHARPRARQAIRARADGHERLV